MHQVQTLWIEVALFAFVFLVVLPVLGLVAKRLFRRGNHSEYRAVPLLSPAEAEFFRCLVDLYGASAVVCPKVRLVDLVRPSQEMDRSKFQIAFNRVSAKHVDYVLLRPDDLGVLGVVELDDRSHGRQDRADRDVFVDDALRQGGIPVCRVKARRQYDLNDLSQQLNEAFASAVSETAGA
jgi:Protein of unknown function (DUF2726)